MPNRQRLHVNVRGEDGGWRIITPERLNQCHRERVRLLAGCRRCGPQARSTTVVSRADRVLRGDAEVLRMAEEAGELGRQQADELLRGRGFAFLGGAKQ